MRRAVALLALLAVLAAAPLALAASTPITETYATLLHQIDSGQVVIAHVNEETDDIAVTLHDGSDEFVHFPHANHKVLIDSLLHHGATVKYTKHTKAAKPVHHVLRYVAAGVVVVLLLIGGGVWMYTRGQRQPPAVAPDADRRDEQPPPPPAAPVSPSP
jgi:hypothetical protein